MQTNFPRLNEEELKEKIVEIITKRIKLPHYKVFYFGSRAAGKAGERSDIDIGIDAPEEIPADVMFEIKDELDNLPIMQKIDLVDFKKVSDDFKKFAMENIEVIYEK